MKKVLCMLLTVTIFGILLAGCLSSESEFVIRVSGSSGQSFSGSYMVVTSGGQSTSKSVDGVVPAQYSVKGDIVSCSFQKQTEYGTLKVEILKGGKVVNQSDTSAAYGVVLVSSD